MASIEAKGRRLSLRRRFGLPLRDTAHPSTDRELDRLQLPIIYGKRLRAEALTDKERRIYDAYGEEYERTRAKTEADLIDKKD